MTAIGSNQQPTNPHITDICRVCRSPGSTTDPLFHPCRCSGSMKYVHQQCLEEWLQHSGKQHCEICNHPFVFTPSKCWPCRFNPCHVTSNVPANRGTLLLVYAESTPPSLSAIEIIKAFLVRTVRLAYWNLRAAIAIFAWTIWIPIVTTWSWRLFFKPQVIAEKLLDPTPYIKHPNISNATFVTNTTAPVNATLSTYIVDLVYLVYKSALFDPKRNSTVNVQLETKILNIARPLLRDVFEGQRILIVAVFIVLIVFGVR
eukprot:jgi/Hompol1/7119/HPOL_005196-RA